MQVERLEDRLLPAAAGDSFANPLAIALAPTLNGAQRSGFVSSSADYTIYRLDNLNANDRITLSVDAQSIGSALDSRLRVFRDTDGAGPLSPVEIFINDNFTGSDSRLMFQADGVSTYYVGVSASGNNAYDPTRAAPPTDSQASVQLGLTHGLFRLNVTRVQSVAAPNLATVSFEVVPDAAQAGDTVQLLYRIENRGTLASSAFDIQFLLSADNRFDGGDTMLTTRANVAPLAAGAVLTGTATVTLPAGLTGERFIGMVIVPLVANGDDPADNANLARGVNWDRVTILTPVVGAPGHTLAAALPLPASGNAQTAWTNTTSSTADFYRFTVTEGGKWTARVTTTSGDTVLSLLRADGTVLIQSAAVSTTDASDFIAQHLTPGDYILRVASRTSTARYRLTTEFTPAVSPMENIPLGFSPAATVSGDFNGDGILDLAYGGSQLVVLLGLGDGSFERQAKHSPLPTAADITNLWSVDLNHDGIGDLVSVDGDHAVSVLLGVGDGTFSLAAPPAGGFTTLTAFTPPLLALGDFNQDGHVDLVIGTAELATGGTGGRLTFYMGQGNGSFDAASAVVNVNGKFVGSLAVGDFNGDGRLDLVSSSGASFLRQADGTFQQIAAGFSNNSTVDLSVADLDGDGNLDLVGTPDAFVGLLTVAVNGRVLVNYGKGDGTFADTVQVTTAALPKYTVVGDFNGDGRWDLAVHSVDVVGVLLGVATASTTDHDTFAAELRFSLPNSTNFGTGSLTTGDFNRDGRLDLATGNGLPQDASVLLGAGDGRLRASGQTPLDSGTIRLVAADFNNDGRADLAGANLANLDFSVILSTGDGRFEAAVGYTPSENRSIARIVAGDFNGDGRLDLAVYHFINVPSLPLPGARLGQIAIFTGVGDGTFVRASLLVDLTLDSTANAAAAANIDVLADYMDGNGSNLDMFAADFNNDGLTDLVINQEVFLTRPNLTFELQATVLPRRPTAVDKLNGDNFLDLVDATGVVLTGNGDGTFVVSQDLKDLKDLNDLPIITNADTTVIGDFDGDGRNDLVVRKGDTSLAFFRGNGNGTFEFAFDVLASAIDATAQFSGQLEVGDFDNDGQSDLAASIKVDGQYYVAVYLGGNASGFALVPVFAALPNSPRHMVVGDFDGDGRADVATVASEAFGTGQVTVLLGRGNGQLFNPAARPEPVPQATPLIGDINRDGVPDVVLLNDRGEILYRQGRRNEPGVFDAPIIVNPGTPARDVVLLTDTVNGRTTVRLAALDFDRDQISIYARNAGGQFVRTAGPLTGLVPTRLAAGDLNGDGRGDLVVVNTGSGNLSVFRGTATGFASAQQLLVGGNGPFDVSLANIDGARGLDIVAVNAASGDVSLFLNQGAGLFGPERRVRAAGGLFDLADFDGEPAVRSPAKTAGLVIGRFTGDSRLDVLAINGASNTFSLLAGLAGGNLANPSVNQAGSAPMQVVAGDFNRDGKLDAAILNAGDRTIDIFLGDGQGNFVHRFTVAAGNEATGLATRDVTGDGVLDLLVGNVYGDLLIIQGNGDGSFKTFTRVEKNVPFVTTDLDGDGIADVIVANQAFDQALSQQRDGTSKIIDNPSGNFSQTGANGLMGPGNLMLVDMNKDGLDDIVIANSGSNDVRVHLATGANGQGVANAWELVARTFFAGTNPTGFTTADLNGDGLLDLLVANKGSNDVSILFGQVSGGNWTLTPGPRLSVGAGPIAVSVRDVTGKDGKPDSVPDLLVSNSFDGTLSILTGLGGGFFGDANPTVINVGGLVVQGLTGDFLLNQSGTIFRFNPGTLTVTPVFASNNGVTSFTQSGGLLYAGRANGDVSELALGNDGLFTATLNFRDAALTDPSALNVVGGEVYVSSSGQTRVFVFGIQADGIPVPDFNSDPSLRDQLASVSALSQAGLALIATLLTGAEGEGIAEGGEIGIVFGLGVGDSDAALALLTALVGATEGGEDGEAIEYTVADEPEFTFNDFIIGLEEALEKLRLELHGPSGTEVPEPLREAVDLTFRGLSRAADGLDGLLAGLRAEAGSVADAATTALKTALQPLGAAAVEATGGELAEVLASTWHTVATASRSAALPLLDSLRWARLPGVPVADAAPVAGASEVVADDRTCQELALLAALTCGMWPTPREPKQPSRRAIRR